MSSVEVIEIPTLGAPSAATPSFPLPAHNPSYLDKHVNVPPLPNLIATYESAAGTAATTIVSQKAMTATIASKSADVIEVVTEGGVKAASNSTSPAAPPAEDSQPSATFMDLFRFASAGDKVMVVFAFFLAFLHGASLPAFSYVFGEFMDTTGSVSQDELLDRVSFLASIMVGIGVFAFFASGLWTALFAYSSQRQGARIRTIYLASIIGKDCAWWVCLSLASVFIFDVTCATHQPCYSSCLFVVQV